MHSTSSFATLWLAMLAAPAVSFTIPSSSVALPKSKARLYALATRSFGGNSNNNNNNNRSFGGNNNNNNYNNNNNSRGDNYNNNGEQFSNGQGDNYYNSYENGNGGNYVQDYYPNYEYNSQLQYDQPPLFGNGDYYRDASEDFRRASSNDRFKRRSDMRQSNNNNNGREVAFGGRRDYGENFGYPDRMYGGDFGNEDFRRGSSKSSSGYGGGYYGSQGQSQRSMGGGGRNRGGGNRGGGGGRMRDYYTPGQREMRQQQDNQGARYGWQQQYDTQRGNVRKGSSNDFRKGSALSRKQDYYTPRDRELMQQQDNQGARYGWQQQYDTDRGNVRRGSSNDFRRGSSYDKFQDFSTPREREMRQMRDNRELIRGGENGYYGDVGIEGNNFGQGYNNNNNIGQQQQQQNMDGYGYNNGQQQQNMDGYGYNNNGQNEFYNPEFGGMNPNGNGYGQPPRRRNQFPSTWQTLRGLFK